MITAQVDVRPLSSVLGSIRRQIPYATAQAINEVVKLGQTAERKVIARHFTLRRETFVLRTVKIKPFATKQTQSATIQIDPQRDVLAKFEDQTEKRPRAGKALAVPIEARPGRTGIVPRALRIKNLQIAKGALQDVRLRRNRKTGDLSLSRGRVRRPGQGLQRTFLAGPVILQRVGRGAGSRTRVLYVFKPRVPIAPELHFERTITRTVHKEWTHQATKWLWRALR